MTDEAHTTNAVAYVIKGVAWRTGARPYVMKLDSAREACWPNSSVLCSAG